MAYKLFSTGQRSSAIAIALLLIGKVNCSATEYVFSAPPEVGQETLEIPARSTEYPLYECDLETETQATQSESESALDSHACGNCIDCEELIHEAESETQFTSKQRKDRQ
ncbi:MAG: hypothetical protein AAGE84_00795 [Cyanobacteria bacterium P01_G01_bin.39]